MGTRSLIAVYMGGEYRIAQYAQWDGYPEGQGIGCLLFLRNEMIEQKFRDELRKIRMLQTEEQMLVLKRTYKDNTFFPEFSRDTGSDILNIVQSGKTTSGCVANNIGFASGAGIFGCEWAWVIDLDKRTFEAYEGFNETPLKPEDRFYFLEAQYVDEYHPVKMVASWSLSNLPDRETFLNTFKEEDE